MKKYHHILIRVRTGHISETGVTLQAKDFEQADTIINTRIIPSFTNLMVADVTLVFIDGDEFRIQVARQQGDVLSLKEVFLDDLNYSIKHGRDVDYCNDIIERINMPDSAVRQFHDPISGKTYEAPSGVGAGTFLDMLDNYHTREIIPATTEQPEVDFITYFQNKYYFIKLKEVALVSQA